MIFKPKLSHDRLISVLNYNPDTGVFTWRKSTGPNCKVLKEAGWRMKRDGRMIQVDGEGIYAHRLAWFFVYGIWPEHEIDHIDGNKLNNAISNLRDVTRSENRQNVGYAQKNSTTKLLGVDYHPCKKMYQARISFNGDRIHIGWFADKISAYNSYLAYKKILHPHVHRKSLEIA